MNTIQKQNKGKTLYISDSVYTKLVSTNVQFHWLTASTHVQKIDFLLSFYNENNKK